MTGYRQTDDRQVGDRLRERPMMHGYNTTFCSETIADCELSTIFYDSLFNIL